jgi:hypothetical protein
MDMKKHISTQSDLVEVYDLDQQLRLLRENMRKQKVVILSNYSVPIVINSKRL